MAGTSPAMTQKKWLNKTGSRAKVESQQQDLKERAGVQQMTFRVLDPTNEMREARSLE
jgi:hypothetical protein